MYWKSQRRGSLVPPSDCQISANQQNNDKNSKHRLSLKDLTGAFVILLIGYIISIAVFIGEKVLFYKNKNLKKVGTVRNQVKI